MRMLEKRWNSNLYWSNYGGNTKIRVQPVITGDDIIDTVDG